VFVKVHQDTGVDEVCLWHEWTYVYTYICTITHTHVFISPYFSLSRTGVPKGASRRRRRQELFMIWHRCMYICIYMYIDICHEQVCLKVRQDTGVDDYHLPVFWTVTSLRGKFWTVKFCSEQSNPYVENSEQSNPYVEILKRQLLKRQMTTICDNRTCAMIHSCVT